jgi:4-hydroxy-tetrahydrodipicolinate reductase
MWANWKDIFCAIMPPPQLEPLPDTAGRGQPADGRKIKIAQFGLGQIGIETVKLAAEKPWAHVVAGIDIDPAIADRTLHSVTGVGSLDKSLVYASFDRMLQEVQPDVVLHTAGSRAGQAFDQIEPMVRAGISVVSSCEELLFPALSEPQRSADFAQLCRRCGAGVVGTGVNPGFVMDVLPVCLTGVSRSVRGIFVQRVVNASMRRMQLQKKIGSGMDPDHFRALYRAGAAGHCGFRESAALICHCLRWTVDQIQETCEPIIAQRDIQTDFFQVKKGLACGLHQVVQAHVEGRTPLVMDLKMYLDAPDPHDAIRIDGQPNLDVTLNGGVAGDQATVAALVNAVPRLLQAGPGLHLMTDLAVPCWK